MEVLEQMEDVEEGSQLDESQRSSGAFNINYLKGDATQVSQDTDIVIDSQASLNLPTAPNLRVVAQNSNSTEGEAVRIESSIT